MSPRPNEQWRVSWEMWAHGWPAAHRTEKVYDSAVEARNHYEGLKSMQADHEPRPCDNHHVWAIRLERRSVSPTEWQLVEGA